MITYDDLIRPIKEGGHYEMSRATIMGLFDILKPTDRVLLYQCHMLDSSQVGRCALVVSGPGRSLDDPNNPPKQIGSVPSQFKQLEGEVDIESLREGMKDYEPPSLAKSTQAVDGDPLLGAALWRVYQANFNGLPAESSTDEDKKDIQKLKRLGLVSYNRSRRGWGLTPEGWDLLEG